MSLATNAFPILDYGNLRFLVLWALIAVHSNPPTLPSQASQQTARLEQLAKAHNIPLHLVLPGATDPQQRQVADTGPKDGQSNLSASQARVESARLKRNLEELRQRKDNLQREISQIEAASV